MTDQKSITDLKETTDQMSTTLQIFPAIDLMKGRCVRLEKGDFEKKTVYDKDPVAVASDYRNQGAEHLHIVDLDGTRDGAARQHDVIKNIVRQTDLKVQTGGGIRHADDVAALLDAGVNRVIIGSMAVHNRDATAALFKRFGGDKIVLAVDVLLGEKGRAEVVTQGWQQRSGCDASDLIQFYRQHGLQTILCTDINRDGMGVGTNVDLYQALGQQFNDIAIQASGGVGSIAHLESLKAAGLYGVIIGKALYENRFTLKDALAVSQSQGASC